MAVPPSQGMNNLTTLIKRLEAATSRLEDIAGSAESLSQPGDSNSNASVSDPPARGPASSRAPNQGSSKNVTQPVAVDPPSQPAAPPLPPTVAAMDDLMNGEVQAFVDASRGIGSLVEEQASAVAKAFADQRRFLLVTTRAKKPDLQSPQTFNSLLKDLQQDMGSVGDLRDSHRASSVKEHLAMVGEGIGALQWLLMDGKPADYVGEILGGAQMYGNRVLKTYKETDQAHVKFVQSYYGLLKALQAYIRKYYPSGVTWKNDGIDAAQAYREADSDAPVPTTNGAPSGGAGGPPPPPPLPKFDNIPGAPPPPPPPAGGAPKTASGAGSGDMASVFEQLNRGESVTSGLKKVDKSEMTHKNPSLRASSVVADSQRSKSPGPGIKPKPQSMRQNSTTSSSSTATNTNKPKPKKELDGNKWLIENWDSPSTPLEIDVTLSQSILISRCTKTTIILHGKANAISIDNSPRTQLLVETLISAVDVIKSSNFAIQITGAVPTILLDQVDGASIYLSAESLSTEVFTSKCSSVNIVLPPDEADEQGDSRECPLPEQIRTVIGKGGMLVSEIVEHAG